MPEHGESFWPTEGFNPTDPAPVVLLKKQAELAGHGFDGEIQGLVKTSVDQGTVYHSLYLKVDSLGNYLFKLLYIAYPAGGHTATGYPITAQNTDLGEKISVKDDQEFEDWLRKELSSDFVRRTIGNILRYIRDRKASITVG